MENEDREPERCQRNNRRGDSPPPDESRTYKNSDLYLCAYLRAQGLTFLRTESEGRKVFFVFEAREDIDRLVQNFFNNGPVRVIDYRNSLRDFKTFIMEIRNGERP